MIIQAAGAAALLCPNDPARTRLDNSIVAYVSSMMIKRSANRLI
jgi:hypothetical protein